MALIHCTAEQRTPAWFAARLGRVTASNAAAVTAVGRGNTEATTRRDYRTQLVVERLTNTMQEQEWTSPALDHGVLYESSARELFAAMIGEPIHTSGFWADETLMIGASLDGHISHGSRELAEIVEIKCPYKTAHHLATLKDGTIPTQYIPQVTHQLLVTDADAVNFVSYDPRLPPPLQLAWIKVHRSEVDIDNYRIALLLFLGEVEKEMEEWVSRIDRSA